jgi:hypothetical protein
MLIAGCRALPVLCLIVLAVGCQAHIRDRDSLLNVQSGRLCNPIDGKLLDAQLLYALAMVNGSAHMGSLLSGPVCGVCCLPSGPLCQVSAAQQFSQNQLTEWAPCRLY